MREVVMAAASFGGAKVKFPVSAKMVVRKILPLCLKKKKSSLALRLILYNSLIIRQKFWVGTHETFSLFIYQKTAWYTCSCDHPRLPLSSIIQTALFLSKRHSNLLCSKDSFSNRDLSGAKIWLKWGGRTKQWWLIHKTTTNTSYPTFSQRFFWPARSPVKSARWQTNRWFKNESLRSLPRPLIVMS